jgi:hypothetical protein
MDDGRMTCKCEAGYVVKIKQLNDGCQLSSGGAEAMLLSFCTLGLLLMLGKLTRVYLKCLHFLYLPCCVIGGLYGVIFLNVIPKDLNLGAQHYFTSGWSLLPEFLINLVFAALFLGSPIPNPKAVWKISGPNLMYGAALRPPPPPAAAAAAVPAHSHARPRDRKTVRP